MHRIWSKANLGFMQWYNNVPSFGPFTLIPIILFAFWLLLSAEKLFSWSYPSYHKILLLLVTASSEPAILQVNFDWLFFPKCITWQLPKMCFIWHFWRITQPLHSTTLHTHAFSAVSVCVAIRKLSDFTLCTWPPMEHKPPVGTSLLFQNCCVLLICFPTPGPSLSC